MISNERTDNFTAKIKLQKRKNMVNEIRKIYNIDDNLYKALISSEREQFVPRGFASHAYKLDALPMLADQWISSPLTVAKMSNALTCEGADSVLEIGCGSGYQALVLSKLIRRVFTIERVERLLVEAKENFKKMGINNIHTRFDDGQNGWREYAPFDRILFSATTSKIPKKLFTQLSDTGILVAPIKKGDKQIITRFIKSGENIKIEELDECYFVPIFNGKEF
ncbi:MAG: protein-L-isoaspartate(D-aspartate) O-methyltransferase [Sulfurospirillum sp.]|nr:protein-L-isoaspartate(D-aspartate) O-methyltransferase [Sulfurospirillum sp.]MBL0702821.1 protein-L-isoaspartate(D-aspartate) O-methyltransferase [Sulfurospirillum sp.]